MPAPLQMSQGGALPCERVNLFAARSGLRVRDSTLQLPESGPGRRAHRRAPGREDRTSSYPLLALILILFVPLNKWAASGIVVTPLSGQEQAKSHGRAVHRAVPLSDHGSFS
jgi:hypothetical protein